MLPDDCDVVCMTEWEERLYQEALLWVNDTRRVFIFSDSEKISSDPRVQIYWMQSPLQKTFWLRKMAWGSVLSKMHAMGPFKEELEECHRAAFGILSDAADSWVHILQNARENQAPYRRGIELAGAFRGVPAVIVGAGPSLAKHKSSLRLFQDKALIFAGGTALSLLDIEPHFAAAIDPSVPCSKAIHAPLCYQARMHPGQVVQGEKLLFPDSASSAINWIYGETSWDAGWTVGNFMTAVALLMGCSPLIFVGMDFCYQDGKKYAESDSSTPQNLIQVNGLWTQRDWQLAARWIEQQEGAFFDTSEGLLKVPKITMQEALDLCPRKWDLTCKEKINTLPLHPTCRFEEWDASLLRCRAKGALEEEPFYEHLLDPLWQIWQPLFERETGGVHMDLHKQLFFQKVIEEHAAALLSQR